MSSDPYDLERFVSAQDAVIARVRAELAAGRKRSHWMWFVFPQLQGLGSSSTAQHYAVASLDEARAYLAHPLLGERLREFTQRVNQLQDRSAEDIFGYPDYLKFRSCLTLFAYAAGERSPAGPTTAPATPGLFSAALEKYFAGEEDSLTREKLT